MRLEYVGRLIYSTNPKQVVMKRNIILMMLFAVASSMYADLVLRSDNSLRVVPSVCTTSGKSIVYSFNYYNGEITVYTPEFLVDKVIKTPILEYQSGYITETATVTPTGVDIVPEDAYGNLNYSMSSYGEASSQDEMIQILRDNYYNPGDPFTDPMGNPACYSDYYSFFYPNLFGNNYPTRWYALIDGTIYRISTYNGFYSFTYNEEDAVWTRTSENIETYGERIYDKKIIYEGVELSRTYLTQNIFNNDGKWEYIIREYSGNLIMHYSSQNANVNDDGTITLTRTASCDTENLGYAVYNEDGQKLGNIPTYEIKIINGKPYVNGTVYDESGNYTYCLYSFDEDSETIDLVEMGKSNSTRRIGENRGIVTVDINAEQAGGEVIVSTTDGKVMASRRVSMGKTQVNDKPLPPGVYVVSLLKNNRVVESEKYIVQ